MSMSGTHKARAREWALGHSSTGKEQVAVLFEITQGEHAGKAITWFGYFTDTAVDRTLDSLRHCGWAGDNFVDMTGLDANEVELVIEPDTYEGKTRDRVRWVNRTSRLALREQMNPGATATFAARMRARALAHKQSYAQGAPRSNTSNAAQPGERTPSSSSHYNDAPTPSDDDIPF